MLNDEFISMRDQKNNIVYLVLYLEPFLYLFGKCLNRGFMKIKIIVPLSFTHSGDKVSKITGQKKYTVKTALDVYNEHGRIKSFYCDDGCKFLISDDISVNVYPNDKEILLHITLYELNKRCEEGHG